MTVSRTGRCIFYDLQGEIKTAETAHQDGCRRQKKRERHCLFASPLFPYDARD